MLFADTSALFAFLVADDVHHPDAVRAEACARERRDMLWTIDPVLTELWLLLRRETGRELSDRLVAGLLERGLQRESLQAEDYARAWSLAQEWADQDFSLTDRQAFASIERSRHLRAWSYDQDFAVIRLGPGPDPSDRALALNAEQLSGSGFSAYRERGTGGRLGVPDREGVAVLRLEEEQVAAANRAEHGSLVQLRGIAMRRTGCAVWPCAGQVAYPIGESWPTATPRKQV